MNVYIIITVDINLLQLPPILTYIPQTIAINRNSIFLEIYTTGKYHD